MPARPHISPALEQLRGWITLSACIVILAALCQVAAYAIVRNTDIRATHLEGAPNDTVVNPERRAARRAPAAIATPQGGATPAPGLAAATPPHTPAPQSLAPQTPGPPAPAPPAPGEGLDANRLRSTTDANMEIACAFISVAGVIAASAMCILSLLGVVVAGGGNVPGIAHTVRAGAWSIVVLGAALPWSGFAGPSMVPGVFCGYATLVAAAEGRSGASGFTSFILVPLAMIALCGCCLWWFRRGVEAGIVLTSLSEVDEALEREMGAIRERGVGRLNPGSRASAGLHQVMEPDRVAVDEQPRRMRLAAGAERLRDEPDDLAPSMTRRRNDPGAARPI